MFGPRGTGKSTWVREHLAEAPPFDLLHSDTYLELLASPSRLEQRIPPSHRGWVVIDEIQKVPPLLDSPSHGFVPRSNLGLVRQAYRTPAIPDDPGRPKEHRSLARCQIDR
ncbi:MAG: AAA family ATPase [Candidatus Binatia bacterium]